MAMAPSNISGACSVDKMLGNAYMIVKHVQENLGDVSALAAITDDLAYLVQNLPAVILLAAKYEQLANMAPMFVTTAELGNAAHAVNVTGKLGRFAWTTDGLKLFLATGDLPVSTWRSVDGVDQITPFVV